MTSEEQIKQLTNKIERQKKMIGKLVDALEQVSNHQRWTIPWLHKLLLDGQRASGRGMTLGEIWTKKLKARRLRNSHPPEAKK